jgi:hypothetical protein
MTPHKLREEKVEFGNNLSLKYELYEYAPGYEEVRIPLEENGNSVLDIVKGLEELAKREFPGIPLESLHIYNIHEEVDSQEDEESEESKCRTFTVVKSDVPKPAQY